MLTVWNVYCVEWLLWSVYDDSMWKEIHPWDSDVVYLIYLTHVKCTLYTLLLCLRLKVWVIFSFCLLLIVYHQRMLMMQFYNCCILRLRSSHHLRIPFLTSYPRLELLLQMLQMKDHRLETYYKFLTFSEILQFHLLTCQLKCSLKWH